MNYDTDNLFQNKVKDSKIDATLIRKKVGMPKACQRISKFRKEIENTKSFASVVWSVSISYPEEIRIITQSKDVDVHSLIGNIGGYLGLFLGK